GYTVRVHVAVMDADHETFEHLYTLFGPFLNLLVHAHGVPRLHVGDVAQESFGLIVENGAWHVKSGESLQTEEGTVKPFERLSGSCAALIWSLPRSAFGVDSKSPCGADR